MYAHFTAEMVALSFAVFFVMKVRTVLMVMFFRYFALEDLEFLQIQIMDFVVRVVMEFKISGFQDLFELFESLLFLVPLHLFFTKLMTTPFISRGYIYSAFPPFLLHQIKTKLINWSSLESISPIIYFQ